MEFDNQDREWESEQEEDYEEYEDRVGRYDRYENESYDQPRGSAHRSRSRRRSQRSAENLEVLAERRKVLETELERIDQKAAQLREQTESSGAAYTDETGSRVSGVIKSEKAKRFLEWMVTEIPSDEARRLRSCFVPLLEGQKDTSIACLKFDFTFSRDLKGKKPNDRWEQDLKIIQNKFTDVIRPLMYLWTIAPSGENNQASQAIADAIRLWCNANLYLTSARRRNVLRATDPGFLQLLQDASLFNVEDRETLFGEQFYDAIIKACRDDEVRKRARLPANRFRGGRTGSNVSRTTDRLRGSYAPMNSFGGQPSRGFRQFPPSRYVPISFEENQMPPVGGRIQSFSEKWHVLSQDHWVLQVVTEGFCLEFHSIPLGNQPPPQVSLGDDSGAALEAEIRLLLEKEAIREIKYEEGLFWSGMFIIFKRSGGLRPIFNLRRLNQYIVYEHFQLESVDSLSHLVRRGDWFTRIDLKDAYLTVTMRKPDRKYLCFQWKTKYYAFQSLPFGLSSAPRAFTKLCRPIAAHLGSRGVRLLVYLEYWLLWARSKEEGRRDYLYATALLEELGFLINREKSCGSPAQTVEHLGLIVDSQALCFALPNDKINKLMT